MTTRTTLPAAPAAAVPRSRGRIVVSWITTTDHKTIGSMYLNWLMAAAAAPEPTQPPGGHL